MTFVKVKEILTKVLNQKGIAKAAQSSLICTRSTEAILELMGKRFQNQFRVISFKNGELKIAILDSVVRQELQLHSAEIIAKINYTLQDRKVKRIYFVE
jgi:hypothetical protein